MDATHIHLVLTHFPIVGTIIGIVILAYGQYSKNNTTKKIALITFIFMAILTIPVFLSGEEAEETIENMAGISENLIEEHEDLAEYSIWLMGLLGVISLVSFFATLKELSVAKTITTITLIVSLVTVGFFAKVGNLGGQIRHSEIRTNNSVSQGENSKGIIKQNYEYDDDDDDD